MPPSPRLPPTGSPACPEGFARELVKLEPEDQGLVFWTRSCNEEDEEEEEGHPRPRKRLRLEDADKIEQTPGENPNEGAEEKPEQTLEVLRAEVLRLRTKAKVIDHHIRCLHTYNETKDIAQMLFGRLAEIRGLRTRDVYEDFDVELDD